MATKAHKNLTGVDLHEPKGITTATSGQTYIADGLGSGVWTTQVIPSGLFITTFATFTATGTWTKPANLFKVRVHCVGSGGNGSFPGSPVNFGAHCSATGCSADGLTPGVGSGGDLNYTGGTGGNAYGDKGVSTSGTFQCGGLSIKEIATASLGATETVTVNIAGTNNNLNAYVLVEQFITV